MAERGDWLDAGSCWNAVGRCEVKAVNAGNLLKQLTWSSKYELSEVDRSRNVLGYARDKAPTCRVCW